MDWKQYPNFSPEEFRCHETGKLAMDADFMAKLQTLRTQYGRPMHIDSGYRAPEHSIERAKAAPGPHAHGKAADIAMNGPEAYELVKLALNLGFSGIGIAQKAGHARYVHLDTMPRNTLWSY